MKRTLFLIRGLPSSGKSTFAGGLFWLGEEPRIFEADTYFYIDGKYVFDPKKLPAAHEDCRQRVEHAAEFSSTHLVVSNTFTQRWEMEPYIELSRIFGLGLMSSTSLMEVVTTRPSSIGTNTMFRSKLLLVCGRGTSTTGGLETRSHHGNGNPKSNRRSPHTPVVLPQKTKSLRLSLATGVFYSRLGAAD